MAVLLGLNRNNEGVDLWGWELDGSGVFLPPILGTEMSSLLE